MLNANLGQVSGPNLLPGWLPGRGEKFAVLWLAFELDADRTRIAGRCL
jgi:hypothetical protein